MPVVCLTQNTTRRYKLESDTAKVALRKMGTRGCFSLPTNLPTLTQQFFPRLKDSLIYGGPEQGFASPHTYFKKMKPIHFISITIFSMLLFSCQEQKKAEEKPISEVVKRLEPEVDANEVESEFITWWAYHYNNISLSSDFIGLSEQSDIIEKKEFLEKLTTANFIPIKMQSGNEEIVYKLFRLSTTTDQSIGTTIKNESLTSLHYFSMEGSQFPEFNFTDLTGSNYTNENTKGKTVILKTWFIGCKACIAEFPELNEFVEKYNRRDDIVFLSIATDRETALKAFLQKREFKYQVIANQKDFIVDTLNLQIYPTHIVVDENGTVSKVVNKASEMIAFVDNQLTDN